MYQNIFADSMGDGRSGEAYLLLLNPKCKFGRNTYEHVSMVVLWGEGGVKEELCAYRKENGCVGWELGEQSQREEVYPGSSIL